MMHCQQRTFPTQRPVTRKVDDRQIEETRKHINIITTKLKIRNKLQFRQNSNSEIKYNYDKIKNQKSSTITTKYKIRNKLQLRQNSNSEIKYNYDKIKNQKSNTIATKSEIKYK